MLREARVLQMLEQTGMRLVPRVVAVAGDAPVGPCYAMTRLQGEAVRAETPAWLDEVAAARASRDLLDCLVDLHALPIEPFVTAKLGRAEGYLTRQVSLWARQRDERVTDRPRDRALPDEPRVRAWLQRHVPTTQRPAVVHGDFKLDNTLLDPTTGAVVAVLDWEMATIGDPLADLGFLLAFWPETPDEVVLPDLTGAVTCGPGFLSRAELADRYATATAADVSHLDWYRVLALWKVAILLEASYGRWLDGDADDPYFATLEKGVPALLAAAADLT